MVSLYIDSNIILFSIIIGTTFGDNQRCSDVEPLYFGADFTNIKGFHHKILHQIDPLVIPSLPENAYFSIQWDHGTNNITTAKSNLENNGFCVFDIRSILGFTSQEIYDTIMKDKGESIAQVINQNKFIKDQVHVCEIKSYPQAFHNIHIDSRRGMRGGPDLVLWIPSISNKHLVTIPTSSFSSIQNARQWLKSGDNKVRKHLETYARIAESGKAVIFWSVTDQHDPCIHAGIINTYTNETTSYIANENINSLIIGLQINRNSTDLPFSRLHPKL